MRMYSHSYWLANFCTTNSSSVLARERWQNNENSREKTQFFLNTITIERLRTWIENKVNKPTIYCSCFYMRCTSISNNFPFLNLLGPYVSLCHRFVSLASQTCSRARICRSSWPFLLIYAYLLFSPWKIYKTFWYRFYIDLSSFLDDHICTYIHIRRGRRISLGYPAAIRQPPVGSPALILHHSFFCWNTISTELVVHLMYRPLSHLAYPLVYDGM